LFFRKIYEILIELYQKHIAQKRAKRFKINCTIKFKKVRSEKIGIMKIASLTEIQRSKRRGAMIQPLALMQRNAKKC
jgi:hypothetical protein